MDRQAANDALFSLIAASTEFGIAKYGAEALEWALNELDEAQQRIEDYRRELGL